MEVYHIIPISDAVYLQMIWRLYGSLPYHSHIRCSIPADDMEIVWKFTISFPYHWPACLNDLGIVWITAKYVAFP